MRFRFKTKKLEALYAQEKGTANYPTGVVDAFFEVMAIVEAATNENDLRAFKSLRFELLKGKRGKRGQRSLRLNQQYRLIVIVEEDELGKQLVILEINKHRY